MNSLSLVYLNFRTMNSQFGSNRFIQLGEDDDLSGDPDLSHCKFGCNRRVKRGLSRGLEEYSWCCLQCENTKGGAHSTECVDTYGDSASLARSVPLPLNISEMEAVCLRLACDALSFRFDLDVQEARAILEAALKLNGLPLLDEKRFLLLFSKFSRSCIIRYPHSREFLYLAFKKVLRQIRAESASGGVHRYFFVLKDQNVYGKYRFKSVIGSGAFGIVHRVVHIASGQQRVCKSVRKGISSMPVSQLESEVRIIARLDHPNIVRMQEFFEDDRDFHLIQEFCGGGDLLNRIKQSIQQQSPLPHCYIAHIVRQVLASLAFMSYNRVIHKDLKPENIMFVERDGTNIATPTVKVIDFGLSEIFCKLESSSTTVAGTAFYMAPEIFRPPFNEKCDIWSCGVIAFFMLTGFLPFFGGTVEEVKSYVLYRRLQWPARFAGGHLELFLPDDAKDFVERLLEKDASNRLSALDAIKHPWLHRTAARKTIYFSDAVAKNICAYSKLTFNRRAMINLIAHVWNFEQTGNIREVFTELDSEHSGFVSVGHMSQALQAVGVPSFEAWRVAKSLDISNSGKITFTALTAGIAYPLIDSNRKIIQTAFQTFAPDSNGRIKAQAIWEVFSGHGGTIPVEGSTLCLNDFLNSLHHEMRRVIETREVNKSGKDTKSIPGGISSFEINLDEFRSWLLD